MPTFTRQSSELYPDDWLKWLGKFIGQPCCGLEVGCYEGRATIWFVENICTAVGSDITVVDWFKGNDADVEKALNRDQKALFCENLKPHWPKLARVLALKSEVALPLLISQGHMYDWIYIDGSHDACDVLADSCMAWLLLKPGGVMIWDDFQNDRFPGVRKAVNGFLSFHVDCCHGDNCGPQAFVEKL